MAFSGNGPVEEWIEVKREEWKRGGWRQGWWFAEKMTLNDTDSEMVIREREKLYMILMMWPYSSSDFLVVSSAVIKSQLVCLKWRTMSPCVFNSISGELLSMTVLCTLSFETKEWCRSLNDSVWMISTSESTSVHAASRAHTRLWFLRGLRLTRCKDTFELHHAGNTAMCCLCGRAHCCCRRCCMQREDFLEFQARDKMILALSSIFSFSV